MKVFGYDPGAWLTDGAISTVNRGIKRGKRRSYITRGNPTVSEMLSRAKEVRELNKEDDLKEEIQEVTTK